MPQPASSSEQRADRLAVGEIAEAHGPDQTTP
jgi:hypothetical protein